MQKHATAFRMTVILLRVLVTSENAKQVIESIYPPWYWKEPRNSVHESVRTFRTCQQTRPSSYKSFRFLQPIDPPETKWQVITMHFIALPPKTKQAFSGIMPVVCKLSKMIRLVPVKHTHYASTRYCCRFQRRYLS